MEEPAANKKLVAAIHRYYEKQEKETIIGVLEAIRMHLAKIDLSDEIYVVNVGGYIGESTRREIAYARQNKKT